MKVDSAHDLDKTDVLPVTERNCAVLDGEKNSWIAGNGPVVDLGTTGVMERDDGKVPDVKLCFVKGATPVIDEPIDNRAAVQLRANCVKDDASVNWEGLEGIFHNLECVTTLKDRHVGVNLGVNRCRQMTHLNSDEFLKDKHHLMDLLGWSRGHRAKGGQMELSP